MRRLVRVDDGDVDGCRTVGVMTIHCKHAKKPRLRMERILVVQIAALHEETTRG